MGTVTRGLGKKVKKTMALEAEAEDFLYLVAIKNETMEVQGFNKFKLSNKFTTLP